jgi:hypothetical protein
MQYRLGARFELAGGQVRVGVAGEQRYLEKYQTRGPHRGRAAEPRQYLLGNDGLNQEKQKSACENGTSV